MFYARIFEFELRGKSEDMAFIDLGDQFLALQKGRSQASDDGRHFGLVVDDKEAVRKALAEAGVEALPGPFLDFRDPWGNRIEIVGYDSVQFSKAPTCCAAWDCHIFPKTRKRQSSLPKREWRQAKFLEQGRAFATPPKRRGVRPRPPKPGACRGRPMPPVCNCPSRFARSKAAEIRLVRKGTPGVCVVAAETEMPIIGESRAHQARAAPFVDRPIRRLRAAPTDRAA